MPSRPTPYRLLGMASTVAWVTNVSVAPDEVTRNRSHGRPGWTCTAQRVRSSPVPADRAPDGNDVTAVAGVPMLPEESGASWTTHVRESVVPAVEADRIAKT